VQERGDRITALVSEIISMAADLRVKAAELRKEVERPPDASQ
jgi:hypothetical protein